MEVSGSKISRVISSNLSVNLDISGTIVAEEILYGEVNKASGSKLINVTHGWSGNDGKQLIRYFGNPFRMVIFQVRIFNFFSY